MRDAVDGVALPVSHPRHWVALLGNAQGVDGGQEGQGVELREASNVIAVENHFLQINENT